MAKLTKKQWDTIKKRMDKGESSSSLAKIYKISQSAISQKINSPQKKIQKMAEKIFETKIEMKSLSPKMQSAAVILAKEMMSISDNLVGGSAAGAKTFNLLSIIANKQANKINHDKIDENILLTVAKLTKTANEAASTAIGLIAANKSSVEKVLSSVDDKKQHFTDEFIDSIIIGK